MLTTDDIKTMTSVSFLLITSVLDFALFKWQFRINLTDISTAFKSILCFPRFLIHGSFFLWLLLVYINIWDQDKRTNESIKQIKYWQIQLKLFQSILPTQSPWQCPDKIWGSWLLLTMGCASWQYLLTDDCKGHQSSSSLSSWRPDEVCLGLTANSNPGRKVSAALMIIWPRQFYLSFLNWHRWSYIWDCLERLGGAWELGSLMGTDWQTDPLTHWLTERQHLHFLGSFRSQKTSMTFYDLLWPFITF